MHPPKRSSHGVGMPSCSQLHRRQCFLNQHARMYHGQSQKPHAFAAVCAELTHRAAIALASPSVNCRPVPRCSVRLPPAMYSYIRYQNRSCFVCNTSKTTSVYVCADYMEGGMKKVSPPRRPKESCRQQQMQLNFTCAPGRPRRL